MSTRVTRKRPRVDDTDEDPPIQKREEGDEQQGRLSEAPSASVDNDNRKDEEFWFDDGTVILVARNVEFRVYAGHLSAVSPVFKDLIAQPHPTRTVSIEGQHNIPCRVVPLTDSPEDLRHVLRAHMPNTASVIPKKYFGEPTPSFDTISACIRLGKKYQMTELYEQSLAHIKDHNTSDFTVWDESTSWLPEGFDDIHVIGIVNLARSTGELSILPTALLTCICVLSGADLVHGFLREDGTPETLTLDDLALCFDAQGSVRKANVRALLRVLSPPIAPTCKLGSACRRKLHIALEGLKDFGQMMGLDPFFQYGNYVKDGKLDLCTDCATLLQTRQDTEHRAMWDKLPELLNIEVPNWVPPPEGQAAAAS
ncbi:hypothetical protein C8Q76DRAFT_826627 [Earliella scabrosa]|nr:hypothetical protein C8Q76DRAFT_826627 [Earliella scabrosa]